MMGELFKICRRSDYGKTICLSQFVDLVRKCDDARHCLSREVVYEMFAYVQQRDTRHDEDHSILDDERIECNFAEFVLCLCACACRLNPNPYEPLLMRVRVFVQTLTSSLNVAATDYATTSSSTFFDDETNDTTSFSMGGGRESSSSVQNGGEDSSSVVSSGGESNDDSGLFV